MEIDIVTRKDFEAFKKEILEAITTFLGKTANREKQWLRSKEVRTMLNISYGTLQNLRVSGRLKYTKVGGVIYYNIKDIEALLNAGNER